MISDLPQAWLALRLMLGPGADGFGLRVNLTFRALTGHVLIVSRLERKVPQVPYTVTHPNSKVQTR